MEDKKMVTIMNTERMISDMINGFRPKKGTANNGNGPSYNIKESKTEFVLELAVPGLDKKDLRVEMIKDSLVLYAYHKEEEKDNYLKKEFDYSSFKKIFHVPDKVERALIMASYRDGIFRVTLPKKEEAVEKVPIQIAIS